MRLIKLDIIIGFYSPHLPILLLFMHSYQINYLRLTVTELIKKQNKKELIKKISNKHKRIN